MPQIHPDSRGRSRSLDEGDCAFSKTKYQSGRNRRTKAPTLRETRRAFTLDDADSLFKNTTLQGPDLSTTKLRRDKSKNDNEEDEDDLDDEIDEDLVDEHGTVLKNLKSTISASLKSIDGSIRSGSITSISSGKSFVSNFSVKSDSGISLPAKPKQTFVQELPKVQEQPFSNVELPNPPPSLASSHHKSHHKPTLSKTKLGRRPWESEPMLASMKKKKHHKKDGTLTERTTSKSSLNSIGEKEKSRAMQSMEHKLMKVIKEVNESDLSETNTPINSPGIFQSQDEKCTSSPSHHPALDDLETQPPLQSETCSKDDTIAETDKKCCDDKAKLFQFSSTEIVMVHQEQEESSEEESTLLTSGGGKKETENEGVPCTVMEDIKEDNDDDDVDADTETAVAKDHEDVVVEDSHVSVMNFEELKSKIKSMPKFRPFHYATNLGGSLDSQDGRKIINNENPDQALGPVADNAGWGKQMSLHDELLSHERLTANEEMRKKITKQQSLPDHHNKSRRRSLKESLMEVVKKPKQFESLKQSFVLLRSNTATVAEEKEDNLTPLNTPKEKEAPMQVEPESLEASASGTAQETLEEDSPKNLRDQISGQAIKSGIVRIWQSWRSSDKTDGPSFTLKRGVSIQPIEVRGRETFIEGGAAGRRTLFQRRRGGSSPLSPQQFEVIAKEDSMSPTSFRRCCMDYGSGELVIRERKLSRGGEASDSSSKDGSIQSDTSLDSEDSCVSVIFVPHPDGKFGMTGEPVPELFSANGKLANQRKQSNSSESSESTQSGKTSPIMSPGIRLTAQGGISPTKATGIGTKNIVPGKFEVIRQSAIGQYEYISSYVNEDGSCSETVYCISERPLEKIEERHTEESESEAEVVIKPIEKENEGPDESSTTIAKEEKKAAEAKNEVPCKDASEVREANKEGDQEAPKKPEEALITANVAMTSSSSSIKSTTPTKKTIHKSFEMEDIPDENPIKCHPEGLASHRPKRLKSHRSRQRASQQMAPNPPKYDYPIVRHHPLFAKQSKTGQSNFNSLLMGNNVRIIRGQSLSSNESMDDRFEIFNPELEDSDSDNDNNVPSTDSSSGSSSRSSSIGSNDSVESVVSASKMEDTKCSSGTTDPSLPKETLAKEDDNKDQVGKSTAPETDPAKTSQESQQVLKPPDEQPAKPEGLQQQQQPQQVVEQEMKKEEEEPKQSKTRPSPSKQPPKMYFDFYESRNKELNLKAEQRLKSLQSLLEENQNVLSTLSDKKRPMSNLSGSDSNSSLNKHELGSTRSLPSTVQLSAQEQERAYRAAGAIPKKPLPAIVEPPEASGGAAVTSASIITPIKSRKKVGKAKSISSVSPAATATNPLPEIESSKVIRQSSVPGKLELHTNRTSTGLSSSTSTSSGMSNRTSPCSSKLQPEAEVGGKRGHLSPGGGAASDTSGILVKGSHESLSESTDSGAAMSDNATKKSSKSPSPSRTAATTASMASDKESTTTIEPINTAIATSKPNPSVISTTTTTTLPHSSKNNGLPKKTTSSEASSLTDQKLDSFDLPAATSGTNLDEKEASAAANNNKDHTQCNPMQVPRRVIKRSSNQRDDSLDSNVPSAKNSIQYSDTSSLLSHRFSTISISSNVSSSDVSISIGGQSGSSCYLASMSSTDFDEPRGPILASSFSLSEAEVDNPGGGASGDVSSSGVQHQKSSKHNPKLVKLKSGGAASRKSAFIVHKHDSVLPATTEELESSGIVQARSRIGTETSVETSVENPTCIDQRGGGVESFEEELLHALSRDDDEDDDVLISNADNRRQNSLNSSNNSGSNPRASLSAASSNESLHSDGGGGGAQTYHRYYHVFKEGELDYLINTYVDNLHIINSYYDHANWCIVAEKVNVWTI